MSSIPIFGLRCEWPLKTGFTVYIKKSDFTYMQNAPKSFELALVFLAGNLASRRYLCLLKTIERMCSLFILQFTGDARSDLIVLCQDLNK